ncbi:hypothetical protein C900_04188 [Fulvivirga imtechensis AK7]|uniref:Uncharacterized protein n=1 Tax=Fulvivirga imtechensis AK7 TaxID=1237149 RepID=L8JWC6_9BACT|nr:hypothetical protein C900_04188 [Fulvivirga imtechensis AK7]
MLIHRLLGNKPHFWWILIAASFEPTAGNQHPATGHQQPTASDQPPAGLDLPNNCLISLLIAN